MKVLIVQTAFIGDVTLAEPLIEAVNCKYPGAEISFLTIPYSAPILRNHPRLKEVIILKKRGIGRRRSFRKTLRKLRHEQFDLALVPHRSLRSALLVFLTGIPRRIGFDRSAGKWLFNEIVKYGPDIHEVERNLSLLGMEDMKITPKIYPGEAEFERVDGLLKGWSLTEGFTAIAPGSIWNTKRWPVKYYHELIGMMKERIYPPVVLIGAPGEKNLCEEAAEGYDGYAFTAAGELNPLESGALLHKAAFLIANDSAAGHIAAAAGCKVIAIFGATSPKFGFAPYGEGHKIVEIPGLYCKPCKIHGGNRCPEKHFRCMLDLKSGEVFRAIEDMIK